MKYFNFSLLLIITKISNILHLTNINWHKTNILAQEMAQDFRPKNA